MATKPSTEPDVAPESAKEVDLKKLADDYRKDRTKAPGYSYRWVTSGGVTDVVVEKIGK